MRWWWRWTVVAALVALPAASPPPACAPLCTCHEDRLACNLVPFHRFPPTNPGVRHVSVSGARLGALPAAALDARALRTLVLVASQLHHIDHDALASMGLTLASLDLAHNVFTEVPIEALRDLKVLNWLNLQNNLIGDLDASTEWGFLADSLSSLSLGNNQLCALGSGALASLRHLVHLDLEGNRLLALAASALPPSVAVLRLSDNLLPALPCEVLELAPRLRHLHLRANALRPVLNATCGAGTERALDSLDLSQNELDDTFTLGFRPRLRPRQLLLDLNAFTSIPPFALEGGRLERLSMSHNLVARVPEAAVRALRSDLARLDLDHNELIELPAGLHVLARLRRLSLAYNRLQELRPPPPHLHYLSLAGNYFAAFPVELRELAPATLVYLDLGYNQISSVTAEAFGAWSEALSTLNLRGNRLVRLAAGAFPASLPLRELVLSFNDLYQVEAGALANLTALQTLDLSSTLVGGEFPAQSTPVPQLTWLSLDNDNIHLISPDDLRNYPSLEYLNLDFNKIIEFPSEAFGANSSSRLRELRLSYNFLNRIGYDFLRGSPELQSVDLSYNRVRDVSTRGFEALPNLQHLSLAGNLLEVLAPRAFSCLPRLLVLDLHDNHLTVLSAASFEHVSAENGDLCVNASYNRITLLADDGAASVPIRILDLSHNRLEIVASTFFAPLGPYLRHVALAHNRLTHVDSAAFGVLPALQILTLSDNSIVSVKRRAFAETPALQILDLAHNAIHQLSVEQFHGLRHLRHLRLAGNRLHALPRDCFKNTVLEHLDLANNQLTIFPSSALAAVGFTLRRLELAHNRLEHLDAAMFQATAFLRELSLASNALTVLADSVLVPLARLCTLDLSGNRLKANFKELLWGVPRLRRLSLADAGLRTAPALPLPELVELDLSGNRVTALHMTDACQLGQLRTLRLARNALTSLRPAMWTTLPRLVELDVSANPVVRLARGSLEGLPRLRMLRMERLRQLEVVEPRAFRSLVVLRDLTLESPVAARGRTGAGASIADIVASTPSLECLTVVLRSAELAAQLHGVVAPRLRALEVRGAAVVRVSSDAFSSLGSARALTLRVRGTGVAVLPVGLAWPLARVPHLALDFSDNELVTFAPATLYPNLTGWNRLTTRLLPGGLVVAGNPLRCACAVSWVGGWLRRWSAEVGGWSRDALAAARASACAPDDGGDAVPLVALDDDEAECHASALSSRAPPSATGTVTPPSALFLIVLLHSLS